MPFFYFLAVFIPHSRLVNVNLRYTTDMEFTQQTKTYSEACYRDCPSALTLES